MSKLGKCRHITRCISSPRPVNPPIKTTKEPIIAASIWSESTRTRTRTRTCASQGKMFRIQTLNGVTINESENANISLPQRRGSAFEAAERDRIMARERMRRLRQKRKEEGNANRSYEALLLSSLKKISPTNAALLTATPKRTPSARSGGKTTSTWKTYFTADEVAKLLELGDKGWEWGRIALLLDGLKSAEEVRRKYEEIRGYSRI
ncbi:hypothetical protein BZA70DRAFT_304729 [Myxozyma melibiosi]|uniref:Myb-like domain-containing protein n=1 Tax=Myxozyma melibiosi TaxID=54550 RepID=A0ABR1F5C8_9ASCO